jgi:Acetyltransferase (GNAT) domain
MSATGGRVSVHRQIPDAQAWDDVVRSSGAPVFYRASVLSAYQDHPFQPTVDIRYLVGWRADRPAAVMPLYLVPARDPFGDHVQYPRTWAISHFWHCYDSWLAVVPGAEEIGEPLWAAASAQALEWGADRFGLINTTSTGPASALLKRTGAAMIPRNQRYQLDLSGLSGFEEHLATLPRQTRQDARRQLRRCRDLGVRAHVHEPPFSQELISRVCDLLELTAARYNPGYYPRAAMAHLLACGGDTVRIPVLTIGSEVVAASVSYLDQPVLHNWAVGVGPGVRQWFSPYLALLALTVDYGIRAHCGRMELGRTNPEWKQRIGARPIDLLAWMADPKATARQEPTGKEVEEMSEDIKLTDEEISQLGGDVDISSAQRTPITC